MNKDTCEFGGCSLKMKEKSNMCGYHKRYNGLNMKDYKICNKCKSPIKLPYKLARCEQCNEQNRKELQLKGSFGKCVKIKLDGNQCNSKIKQKNEHNFCNRHLKLLEKENEKKEEKKQNIRRCNSHYQCNPNEKGKKKDKKTILEDGYLYETCLNCRNRNRPEEEKYENDNELCSRITEEKNPCKNLVSNKENKLCDIHYRSMLKSLKEKEDRKKGIRRCNSTTNCGLNSTEKAVLPEGYEFKRCEYCLENERIRSIERKQKKNKKREEIDEELDDDIRGCWTCGNIFQEEDFLNSKGEYGNHCSECRKKRAENERGRDRKGRELSEDAKETKRIWRVNNPEKIKEYLDKYRQSYVYKNRQNERNRVLREYRIKNPEKFHKYNEKRKQNIEYKLYYYKNRAKEKSYSWEITDEYAFELFSEPCFYCNEFNEYGINGIDRVDNNKGYIDDNIVSCCMECNMIKCDMEIDTFLQKIEHILTFNNLIEGNLYQFSNDSHKNYQSKVMDANSRSIYIDISEEQFDEISKKPCYICGKKTNEIHHNGIDRIDNNKGYVNGNIASCCGNCNYMKGTLKLSYFIYKIYQIYKRNSVFDKKTWLCVKLDIHLRFRNIIGQTLTVKKEIHPRRKIQNEELEKLIQDNKNVINKGSLNVTICNLYKKLESEEIIMDELIEGVKTFIEESRNRKKEKEKHNFEFSVEIENICKPYKNIGKFRKFISGLKKKVIEGTVEKKDIKEKIEIYIKTNIKEVDKFEFAECTHKLIKKNRKHGKFRNHLTRYKKKVINEKIVKEQQLKDIQKYIDEYINI